MFSDLNSDCEACRLREERMGEECIAREEAAKEAGLPYECECDRLKCTHTKEEQEGLTVRKV